MSPRLTIIAIAIVLAFVIIGILLFLEPEWVVARLRKRSPEVLYSVDTPELVVALTIDDGPDPVETPKILDVLQEYDAHATFFMITSRVPGNEMVLQRMVEEGHELANHLVYDEPSISLSDDQFEAQLLEAGEILSAFGAIRWFRPGSGWYNDEMLEVVDKHGYRCALGSVYPFDPQIGSAWFIENYVLSNATPGAIVVLHDFGSRGERTAEALKTILPELKDRGYQIVTLSKLVELGER